MNSLTIIMALIGLVIAGVAAAGLRRFGLWRRLWQRLILLIICLVGGLLVADNSAEFSAAKQKQSWPDIKGRVIRSEVIGERAFRPNIVYQYAVDETLFTDSSSLSPASFGGRNARRRAAETIVSGYTAGSELTVYYDPQAPSRSVLKRHIFWAVYGKLGFGFLLYIAGLAWLLAGIRPRPVSSNTP